MWETPPNCMTRKDKDQLVFNAGSWYIILAAHVHSPMTMSFTLAVRFPAALLASHVYTPLCNLLILVSVRVLEANSFFLVTLSPLKEALFGPVHMIVGFVPVALHSRTTVSSSCTFCGCVTLNWIGSERNKWKN